MRKLGPMSILWLVTGHIKKLGKKWDKRKAEMEKWGNGVDMSIEKKLRKELEAAE